MKRKRILTQFLLYVLMFMFLIVAGCSSGSDDNDDDDQNQNQPGPTVSISGMVTDSAGNAISGVVMSIGISFEVANITLWEGAIQSTLVSPIMTDNTGSFSFPVPIALLDKYTVVLTPAKKGYTFSPSDRPIPVRTDNITGQNFTATAVSKVTQRKLYGTWRMNLLRTGSENMWVRARMTIGNTGVAQCLSYETSASAGDTTCPADFDLTLTVNEDTGAIIQSGDFAPKGANHMTINSTKNFMAGTATAGTRHQIMIAQKEDATENYSDASLEGAFVVHGMVVGATNEWWYGTGETVVTGEYLMTSMIEEVGPSGPGTTSATINGVVFNVAADGVVTIVDALGARASDFEGFLSADKKTMVGTYTDINGDYQLMVVQVTGGQAASNMTGWSDNHLLGVADNSTFWAYHEINVSRLSTSVFPDIVGLSPYLDIMLSYNWNLSLPYEQIDRLGLMKIRKININATTGAATITNPETDAIVFHGQLAFDGTFMVGTETMVLPEGTFYTLNVITH